MSPCVCWKLHDHRCVLLKLCHKLTDRWTYSQDYSRLSRGEARQNDWILKLLLLNKRFAHHLIDLQWHAFDNKGHDEKAANFSWENKFRGLIAPVLFLPRPVYKAVVTVSRCVESYRPVNNRNSCVAAADRQRRRQHCPHVWLGIITFNWRQVTGSIVTSNHIEQTVVGYHAFTHTSH